MHVKAAFEYKINFCLNEVIKFYTLVFLIKTVSTSTGFIITRHSYYGRMVAGDVVKLSGLCLLLQYPN